MTDDRDMSSPAEGDGTAGDDRTESKRSEVPEESVASESDLALSNLPSNDEKAGS